MEHRTLIPVGDSVPRAGPSGHKTGVISDSRPVPFSLMMMQLFLKERQCEVIVLHLQHEAST